MNELELLRHKVQELEERLVQLEPPAPHKRYRNVTDECSRVMQHVPEGCRLQKVIWRIRAEDGTPEYAFIMQKEAP